MARIRTIKPEFWTDGAMIALPFEARLFYIGMWNHSCDRGHMSDDPMGLKLKVLPADPVDGAALVDMLIASGRVERIELPGGRRYLVIPRFNDHQRVDTRWNSRCPVCAHLDSVGLTETHASLGDLTPGGEGRGKEGNGEEGADAPLSPFCSKHPQGTDDPCRACGTARKRYEKAEADAKSKPTQIPAKYGSHQIECTGEHRWLPGGTCMHCTARKATA
ncbi:hypothetical protein [Microbacterium sp. NPDC089696]|uniref:hypothetical protein n=1 Tax=Microbacterium sp. NPDC089696 TaxID=3364199 RepID=UPI00381BB58A